MKKYIIILILLFVLFLPIKMILFADDTLNKNGFELYEQRVDDICKKYNPEKKIIITEEFKKALTPREKEDRAKNENHITRLKDIYTEIN
jgi:hypothetical protein